MLADPAGTSGKKHRGSGNSRGSEAIAMPAAAIERDDDTLYEILKHADAKTLATAACVNRRWRQAAQDETLWENVCTINWCSSSSASSSANRSSQLRSVVLALGGFRRLYALCLRPLLSRPRSLPSSSSSSAENSLPAAPLPKAERQWSKDEVHLSLSLFSIDCYERLGRRSYSKRHRSPLKFLCKSSRAAAGDHHEFGCLVPNAAASLELSGVN